MRFSKFVSLKGIFFGLRFKDFFQPCPYKVPWQRRITKWMKWDDERLNPRHSCLICPPNFLCALTCYFCFQNLSCLSHWIDMAEAAIVYRCYAMVFIAPAASWPKQPLAAAMAAPAIYIISGTYNSAVRPCSWFGSLQSLLSTRKDFQSQYH